MHFQSRHSVRAVDELFATAFMRMKAARSTPTFRRPPKDAVRVSTWPAYSRRTSMPPTLLLSGFPVLVRAHDDIRQTDDGLTRLLRTTDWGIEGANASGMPRTRKCSTTATCFTSSYANPRKRRRRARVLGEVWVICRMEHPRDGNRGTNCGLQDRPNEESCNSLNPHNGPRNRTSTQGHDETSPHTRGCS